MTRQHALPSALTALALAATMPLAACGDDDDEESGASEPTAVAFELKGSGKSATMEAPDSVKGGIARITFKNSTKKNAGVQLARIEGDHTAKEAVTVAQAWGEKGKPLPDWVRLAGGTGSSTKPGASNTATQPLAAGKYLAVEINSNIFAEFEVTSGDGGELPTPSARIDAVDYSFNATGLKAGTSEVVFENKGREPHFVVGLPIKPGKTIEDVKKYAQTEKGESPVEEENGTFDSPLLDGGGRQVVELKLKKGKYALLCFITDRKGGPPHVAKGMVSEAVVE